MSAMDILLNGLLHIKQLEKIHSHCKTLLLFGKPCQKLSENAQIRLEPPSTVIKNLRQAYERDGYVTDLQIFSPEKASELRERFFKLESKLLDEQGGKWSLRQSVFEDNPGDTITAMRRFLG